MSKQSLAEDKALDKLEQAAEEVEQVQPGEAPEQIQKKAARPTRPPREKIPVFWFLPYLIAALLAGAGILFLEWKPEFFSAHIADKLHGYLLGALGVAAVLAVAKAIEVYAIGSLRNPVARFNLRRVLRLLVWLTVPFIIIPVIFLESYSKFRGTWRIHKRAAEITQRSSRRLKNFSVGHQEVLTLWHAWH